MEKNVTVFFKKGVSGQKTYLQEKKQPNNQTTKTNKQKSRDKAFFLSALFFLV